MTTKKSVFVTVSLKHSFSRFIQTADSFWNQASKCNMNESLNHSSNKFVQKYFLVALVNFGELFSLGVV